MDRQRLMEYQDAKRAVPAFNCDTERQKEVFTNFYYAACSLIGGNENTPVRLRRGRRGVYQRNEGSRRPRRSGRRRARLGNFWVLRMRARRSDADLPEALQPRRQRLHAQMRRSYRNRNGALSPLR